MSPLSCLWVSCRRRWSRPSLPGAGADAGAGSEAWAGAGEGAGEKLPHPLPALLSMWGVCWWREGLYQGGTAPVWGLWGDTGQQ